MKWVEKTASRLEFSHVQSLTFSFTGDEPVISEWELILNRAGIACDEVEATRLIVCPKHRFKLTTLYKAKVTETGNPTSCLNSFQSSTG